MNLSLIGMPGAGKSYFGRMVADRLGCEFIDPDKVIESVHGKSLQEVIAQLGEEAFTVLEGETTIAAAESERPRIIATGGSIVYNQEAMRALRATTRIVYLEVSLSKVEHEVVRAPRGLIGLEDRTIADLYRERVPLYEDWAEATVDAMAPEAEVLEAIVREASH